MPLERARMLHNANEHQWSCARQFYVEWSLSADMTVSARRCWCQARAASATPVTKAEEVVNE